MAATVLYGEDGLRSAIGTHLGYSDWLHVTPERLALFAQANREKLAYYNSGITDANFPKPSRILMPGQRLAVQAFKQIVVGSTTSIERMEFLRSQNAVFVGAQGLTLVFDQKRNQLAKNKKYVSSDERDRFWSVSLGFRVPELLADSRGGFSLRLGYFGPVWDDGTLLLCFCEVE